jgi:hypothetical protein
MRRWASVTALLTIFYGFGFLLHERPPTSGHALAGLLILGLAIFLLGAIAGLSRQRSRANATWLLVFQVLTTVAAVGALLMQRLPFTVTTFLAIVVLSIPILGSARHFRPETWTPRPLTDRTLVTNIAVELFLVGGAIALMISAHSLGLILLVVSGCLGIAMSVQTLRLSRALGRYSRPLPPGSSTDSATTGQDQPLAS